MVFGLLFIAMFVMIVGCLLGWRPKGCEMR